MKEGLEVIGFMIYRANSHESSELVSKDPLLGFFKHLRFIQAIQRAPNRLFLVGREMTQGRYDPVHAIKCSFRLKHTVSVQEFVGMKVFYHVCWRLYRIEDILWLGRRRFIDSSYCGHCSGKWLSGCLVVVPAFYLGLCLVNWCYFVVF